MGRSLQSSKTYKLEGIHLKCVREGRKSQGVPEANPTWCLFYKAGRVGKAGRVRAGRLDQRGPFRAWIHVWDRSHGLFPCLGQYLFCWEIAVGQLRQLCTTFECCPEFACGQFLEASSACCCTQGGSQEEELRKRPACFALKNCWLFCFHIARYWIFGNKVTE